MCAKVRAHKHIVQILWVGIIKVNLSPTCDVFWDQGPVLPVKICPSNSNLNASCATLLRTFHWRSALGRLPRCLQQSWQATRQTTGPWLQRRQLVVGFQASRFQNILNFQSGSQGNFRWGPTSTSIFTLEPSVGHGMILCMPLPTCCSSSVGQHRLRSLKIRPVTR